MYSYARLPHDVARLLYSGHFKAARNTIARLLNKEIPEDLRSRLLYELERIRRIEIDYSIPEGQAVSILRKNIPGFSMELFEDWLNRGYLDFILIDGERYYYRRFLDNLLFLCDEKPCTDARANRNVKREKMRNVLRDHVYQIIRSGEEGYYMPRRVRVRMEVRLDCRNIPHGETIRCWLPFPRIDQQQNNVKLLHSDPEDAILAPPDHPQRTIYMEKKANGDTLTFSVTYEYTIRCFYIKVNPNNVEPYDEDSDIYIKYTMEQPPHIIFTRYIKNLAREIVGDIQNPYLKAKRIYEWITRNMTYTYVAEYSTYESICEYVSRNLRGDCGFHAILFITLCRAEGIPARWQSGWYANPAAEGPSPHDWAQFYVEPYGWLYVDASFGRSWRGLDKNIHDFYFGNIDNFRTIFNIDIMARFFPEKKHLRSDPVDNQRGELEWREGNIYFDSFQYSLKYVD